MSVGPGFCDLWILPPPLEALTLEAPPLQFPCDDTAVYILFELQTVVWMLTAALCVLTELFTGILFVRSETQLFPFLSSFFFHSYLVSDLASAAILRSLDYTISALLEKQVFTM